MRVFLPIFVALACVSAAYSQSFGNKDTLLVQNFTVDPSDTMLLFPTGNDEQWVNWDADNLEPLCAEPGSVLPGNWFWEGDLGEDPNAPPTNFAFTSCAYFEDTTKSNQNWLITPPLFIPDSTVMLGWRSLPLEGPGYLDGYKVLVSTTSNEPFANAFTDTIFVAAEMDRAIVPGSLNPDDYVFTPGYVHADRYTKQDYFYLPFPGAHAYGGKFEPHLVSLKQFAHQRVYIAFLHDTKDGSTLQIDDIAVVQGETSSAHQADADKPFFQIHPNPARDAAVVSWDLPLTEATLRLSDQLGRILLEQTLHGGQASQFHLDIHGLPAGIYLCTLQASSNQTSQLLVKR